MILGLDIGTKRTGVAITEGEFVREYTTLATAQGLPEQVDEICRKEGITQLVVGMPLLEDGSRSDQAAFVEMQAEEIGIATHLPITFEDEVLTTVEARRLLELSGLSPATIEQRIDQMAARLILEQHLSRMREVY